MYVCLHVCMYVCLFVSLYGYRFLLHARIGLKLAVSNFARWFRCVLGRESPTLGNFVPPEAQNWTNRPATAK